MIDQPVATGLQVEIAGMGVWLDVRDEGLAADLAHRYRAFIGSGRKAARVQIRLDHQSTCGFSQAGAVFGAGVVRFNAAGFRGHFDASSGEAGIELSVQRCIEGIDYFLRVVVALLAHEAGGMLFHGAGIVRSGQTYIFYGYSGVGKTTVARLSQRFTVLNDDLLVLLPAEAGWQVFGTPFWNPTQVKPAAQQAPLRAMFHLVQSRVLTLKPIAGGQALAQLLACIPVLTGDATRSADLLSRCSRLAATIPCFDLHFLPDDTFWQAIEHAGLV